MCHCKSELADFNKAYGSYELQKCATIVVFFSAYSWFHGLISQEACQHRV